jgi:plastocyanin
MLPLAIFVGAIAIITTGLLAGLLLSAGGGGDADATPTVLDDTEVSIDIRDFEFQPPNVSVPAGATVTWVNHDAEPHDATARDDSWRTDTLGQDESESLTFDEPGTWDYYCTIHPYMEAVLTVRAD